MTVTQERIVIELVNSIKDQVERYIRSPKIRGYYLVALKRVNVAKIFNESLNNDDLANFIEDLSNEIENEVLSLDRQQLISFDIPEVTFNIIKRAERLANKRLSYFN